MAAFEMMEAVNSPGTPGRTGDDRYGFDAGAGTAWVLDGATDVTALRPFPQAESGAAWVAEALSQRLMVAPGTGMDTVAYWRDVMGDVRLRAARDSALPLDSLPPEAWPIASGVWLRRQGEVAELAWMGDCVALDLGTGEVHGANHAIVQETEESRKLAPLSEAERWEQARQSRIATNTSDRPIFGLDPDKAAGLSRKTIDIAAGQSLVLMSDGFYRLVEPYGIAADGAALAALIREQGLSGAISRLRAHEAETADADIVRIKPSDDSCALWIRFS